MIASLISCAQHKVAEQKVEREVKEVVITKNETVSETVREFIIKSNSLTEDQKTKLLDLQTKTHAQSLFLKEEIEKSRIVLIQTVLEPKMNEHEYRILKKKITALEKKKLENGFNAISVARNIIEPQKNIDKRNFYNAFMNRQIQEF